ncbi:uncharacterized protein LOC144124676 isoform X1 [Amblyomma americanum]
MQEKAWRPVAMRSLPAGCAMNAGKVLLLRCLLVLLLAAPLDAFGADQPCNLTQVRECYSNILDSVIGELSQKQSDASVHENLCKKYAATSQCKADAAQCLPSLPALQDMEMLYSSIRQEACGDVAFTLLRSLGPTGECTPLPFIVSCVQRRQLQFDNSTEDTKARCNELAAGLLGCLNAPDVMCAKNRKRATYARKTLGTLMKIGGCDAGDGSSSTQHGGRPRDGIGGSQDSTGAEKCWYKQLKRCNEKQIKEMRKKRTKLLVRNMLPNDSFSAGICRKTRKVCHQHSTVESCAAHEQDAIRRLEEAMNEAQALLCKDERALLKNLLLSYKWWDIKHFTKCSSDIQVNSITDFLFNRPRIHSDCRLLKSRLFRCLNESYAAADEADPKPDVDGARQVLAIFLDRMTCVDARDLPHVHDATTAPDDAGEADYPADEAEGNATDANGSAMPVLSHGAESGTTAPAVRKPALAGLVLLMVMSTRYKP